MMDSKKAAEIAENSHMEIRPKILAEVLAQIEEAATEGYRSADYYSKIFVGHNHIADYLIKSLQERGFGVSPIDKGIQIDWGLNTPAE